ncbi:protein hobbit isoform X2 [Hetaerina americana]|uniref:protein hobbit isoform X2 n=1 Tax=Hetaerina americana TaxID=62018 RepID=UPI003A7F431D
MNGFEIFIVICAVIVAGASWLLPKLLSWHFKRRFHVDVRIGGIRLPYIRLKDVHIVCHGFTVHIEEVGFQSSFFNSEVTKLVSVIIKDVRINKDVGGNSFPKMESSSPLAKQIDTVTEIPSFHNKKIPPMIITFAQFMAVRVYNVSVMLLRVSSPEWLLHASADSIHVDGSIVHNSHLLVNVCISSATAKVLKHAHGSTINTRKQGYKSNKAQAGGEKGETQTCLGQLSFGVTLEAALVARGALSVERLYIGMEHTQLLINEGFYSFAQREGPDTTLRESMRTSSLASQSEEEVLHCLSPIIPKTFALKMENANVTGMKEHTQTHYTSSLQCFQVNTTFNPAKLTDAAGNVTSLPQIFLALQVEELDMECNHEKVILLKKLSADGKVEDSALNLYVLLDTLAVMYNHADIFNWVSMNFQPALQAQADTDGPSPLQSLLPVEKNVEDDKPSWLGGFFQRFHVKGCVELWNVSGRFILSPVSFQETVSLGFSHTKLTLDQQHGIRTDPLMSPSIGFVSRSWMCELLMETAWCRLGNLPFPTTSHHKKQHSWGSPFSIGVLLAKIRTTGSPVAPSSPSPKLQTLLDNVRLEWSSTLLGTLLVACGCMEDYQKMRLMQRSSPQVMSVEKGQKGGVIKGFLEGCGMTVTLTGFNLFLFDGQRSTSPAEYNSSCLMLRVDSASLEGSPLEACVNLEGAKAVTVSCALGKHYPCSKSQELKAFWAYLKQVKIVSRRLSGEINVHLLEEVKGTWSTELYLRLRGLTAEIKSFCKFFSTLWSSPDQHKQEKSESKVSSKSVTVRAKGDVGLIIILSGKHQLLFSFDDLTINSAKEAFGILANVGRIAVDKKNIFSVEGLNVSKISHNAEIMLERANVEGFVLPWNKTWGVNIKSLKMCFPYDHKYAEAVQNEFVNMFKWVRQLHRGGPKVKRTPFTASSPLPCDLLIKVDDFLFEMSDDPFEVRLRDNYELLEDEYQESQMRQRMLDSKVQELFKAHLILPAGRLEGLYASLIKKNAEIYIQRSKLMAAKAMGQEEGGQDDTGGVKGKEEEDEEQVSPPSRRLFGWLLEKVEILALADPSIHGTEKATGAMREMDSDSPWPEEGLEFTTLWCRWVRASCRTWRFQLRDFPQPLMLIKEMHIWGKLVGAEQEAPPRARRTCTVDLGGGKMTTIERGMTSLKFYHDFSCDVEQFRYAFGPCWEPVIAQCNLSFEKIMSPSRDPSRPLPFWDKARLILHGRLTMSVQQLTVFLHASLDPYNTTEEMEVTWTDVVMDWTNAKFVFKGDLDVYVRTASKYDDCRLLHLPNLRLTLKLGWVCLADPKDHHSVLPCAPDRLPEYSSNQEHDSFRAFRSQNVNLSISLETKPVVGSGGGAEIDGPIVLLYGSTLRWFENLKLILSGVTRPTRRGALFKNLRPRKPQLSRHYRRIHLSLSLHRFQVCYWMSFAMQRGFELVGGRVSCSSEHILSLVPIDDGLKHRPRAEWSIMYMNCELNDAEIWLQSALQEDPGKEHVSLRQPVEKCYCLSVAKVSYGREATLIVPGAVGVPPAALQASSGIPSSRGADGVAGSGVLPPGSVAPGVSSCPPATSSSAAQGASVGGEGLNQGDTPIHRLVVYDLKGAWTKSNRDVAFALFDTFVKTKQMKKNLSTEALKGFRGETSTPMKSRTRATEPQVTSPNASLQPPPSSTASPSPMTKLQSGHAATMLQQLIAEAENKSLVFSDDLSSTTTDDAATPVASSASSSTSTTSTAAATSAATRAREYHSLQGLAACQEDDVLHKNWLIELVNSQVLLKGCETKGYVILSAAKAQILQRIHRPVWKDRTLVSKTTWVGSLECMQYYATVSAGENDTLDENIMWLTVDNIEQKEDGTRVIADLPDVPHLVGSGQSVGGVVSETVGGISYEEGENSPVQLQRIVSRCKCEFFYAGYGESSIDPAAVQEVPLPPSEEGIVGPWERRERAVDAFTLMHHDLDVCTNSLQYAMILDIVNNLLLYVEPRRKEAYERLQRMRFQLQLHSVEDQRRPIQQVQNQVRSLLSKLRRLEKETYMVQRALTDESCNEERLAEMEDLEKQVYECKELLNSQSEELDMMISCHKETQLTANQKQMATTQGEKPVYTVRANEICFKHAQWRLTEADGQLGIADLVLSNFLYTKISKSDDSVDHLLELGYVRMLNLLPHQVYREVLCPTEIQSNMPVDRKRAVRVYCREKAPVGGISVKEHFEINVVPMTIALTKQFFNTMFKFCFPERDPENIDGDDELEGESSSGHNKGRKGGKGGGKKGGKETNFYVSIEQKDDVEKMKERAEKNKLFIYIKIPEVPVRVSYKGEKEKNLRDIRDFSLVIPTLEYHNVTWTWLDLLLAMKSDSRRVILSQAIKQKLQIKMNRGITDEGPSPQEEDKARMLLGSRLMPGDNRSLRKSIFKSSK